MLLTLVLGKNTESFTSLLYLKITFMVAVLTSIGVQTARLEILYMNFFGDVASFY